MTDNKLPRRTRNFVIATMVLVILTVAIWASYDIVAFSVAGGVATISTFIGNQFRERPITWFAWCVLTGHLVWMGTPRTSREWEVCVGVGLIGFIIGTFVTWLRTYLTTKT